MVLPERGCNTGYKGVFTPGMEIASFQVYLCKSDSGWSQLTVASHNVTLAGQEAACVVQQSKPKRRKKRTSEFFCLFFYLFLCPSNSLSQLKKMCQDVLQSSGSNAERGKNDKVWVLSGSHILNNASRGLPPSAKRKEQCNIIHCNVQKGLNYL